MKENLIVKEQMTQEMVDTINNLPDFKQEWHLCEQRIKEAKKSGNTPLPCTSITGDKVIQLSRIKMYDIEDYWKQRQLCVCQFLTDEEWQECKQESKAGMYLQ